MNSHLILASFGQVALTFLIVMVSLLLMGLILLQKNRGSGLSGAFGGVGGHTAFGTKTGDFLTWVTVGLAAVFLILSVVGNFVFDRTAIAAVPAAPAPADAGAPPVEGPVAPAPANPVPISVNPAAPAPAANSAAKTAPTPGPGTASPAQPPTTQPNG